MNREKQGPPAPRSDLASAAGDADAVNIALENAKQVHFTYATRTDLRL